MDSRRNNFFTRLRSDSGENWKKFLQHPFVVALGDASLPEQCFRYYLVQDFIFLFQFSRAYALAAYKSENITQLRQAINSVKNIVDVEMKIHIEYCTEWGIDLDAVPLELEDLATTAYTRFVLDCGHKGDLLDLATALIPCVAGYAEIGSSLENHPSTVRKDNPYLSWIEMYASAEYQKVAREAIAQLDELAVQRGGDARFKRLVEIFDQATKLETEFWQMGWNQRNY